MADALSRRYTLLSNLESKMLGFEHVKDLYENDNDFTTRYREFEKSSIRKFYRLEIDICLKKTNFVYPIIL